MTIMGLQKLTLLDYPGKLACTVFTGGCNFRCPFCHNASLVIPAKFGGAMPTDEFFSFLEKRRGILQGVCVSGGEPTLMFDLEEFITRIKSMGFLVKLDTNGSRPEVLRSLTYDWWYHRRICPLHTQGVAFATALWCIPRGVAIRDDSGGILQTYEKEVWRGSTHIPNVATTPPLPEEGLV